MRHHGFIPWEDDIDIGMLREDFLEPIHTEETGENLEDQLVRLRELLGGEWTEETDD